METNWILNTHGDPLGAVRHLLRVVWEQVNLDALLVPVNGSPEVVSGPAVLEDKALLNKVTPFKPLMVSNAAGVIPDLIKKHPHDRLGVLLRPCEVRTLIEMVKHDSFHLDNLTSICIDCLGTFPIEEFEWRAQRKGSPERLTRDSLKFARQGGIVAYRYRSACQLCANPQAIQADINIGVLGMPVRQQILISTPDPKTSRRIGVDRIADQPADDRIITQRVKTLAKLAERHRRTRDRVIHSLGQVIPEDIHALAHQFESCGECQECFNACPICLMDHPQRGEDGRYLDKDLARWLISCSGCGICEQACPNHRPLSTIFTHLQDQLADSYQYVPGRSQEEALPAV